MTPVLLAGLVGLASFFTLSTLLAAGIAVWWRTRGPALVEADRLFVIRMVPVAGGLALTALIVAPAFVRFEPQHDGEQAGPLLLALAAGGAMVLATGLVRVVRAVAMTRRLRLRLLASASTMPPFDDATPAHLIDVPYPVVAIIGIVHPVLVVSRDVAGGCSADEVRLIAAHERAHLRALDNLKRLAIDGCPDVLRWTALGRDIASSWAASAEDAADDAATGGDRRARIALAAVLLRVARMAVGGSPAPQLVSALVGLTGVERRVRRLAGASPLPERPRASLYLALVSGTIAILAAAGSHEVLAMTYSAAEAIVGLWR